MTSKKMTTVALFLAMSLALPAWAQPVSEDEASSEEAAPEEEVRADDMGTAAFPRVSDDEETIYAVQRKAFLMNKKFELSVLPAFTFTDRFVQTYGGGLAAAHHVAENFSLEGFFTYLLPNESSLTEEILRGEKLTPEIAKLTQMLWGAGIGAQWSPIYGKIEIFDSALGNFSFFVGVGVGVGQTRVTCTPATELDPEVFGAGQVCAMVESTGNPDDAYKVVYEPSRLEMMGTLSGGVRFSFSNSIGLKIEAKDWITPARVFSPSKKDASQRYTDAIRNNVLIQIGVSFLFGGEDN
jgi:outer membrane beta-barrel protein